MTDTIADLQAQIKSLRDVHEVNKKLEAQLTTYKKAHTVHKLDENRDQSAFVFTARIQHLVDEFAGVLSTAAAIGALEVVKHELIADALEDNNDE